MLSFLLLIIGFLKTIYQKGESHRVQEKKWNFKPHHQIPKFSPGWGMSETSPIGLIAPLNDTIEGSCGVNVPNTQIKIVDVSTGEALGPNQRGEVCLKGPQVS
jgi:acyl-CoA synthetase (AMP-forming)/AMP-acid ligase II